MVFTCRIWLYIRELVILIRIFYIHIHLKSCLVVTIIWHSLIVSQWPPLLMPSVYHEIVVMSTFIPWYDIGNITTGAASGAGNTYPSGAPDFISSFHKGSCCPVICVSLLHVIVLSFEFWLLLVWLRTKFIFFTYKIYRSLVKINTSNKIIFVCICQLFSVYFKENFKLKLLIFFMSNGHTCILITSLSWLVFTIASMC